MLLYTMTRPLTSSAAISIVSVFLFLKVGLLFNLGISNLKKKVLFSIFLDEGGGTVRTVLWQ